MTLRKYLILIPVLMIFYGCNNSDTVAVVSDNIESGSGVLIEENPEMTDEKAEEIPSIMGFFNDPSLYLDGCGLIDMSKIYTSEQHSMGVDLIEYYDSITEEFLYQYNNSYSFWGTYSDYGESRKIPVINMFVDSIAKKGDIVTIEWAEGQPPSDADENDMISIDDFVYNIIDSDDIEVMECNGKLYISSYIDNLSSDSADYKVDVYYESKLIDEERFSLQAQ